MWKNDICGIYKIENLVNGKIYIGQSKHIKQRWSEHKKELRKNRHTNNYLQRAWNKYGEENFSHIILEECAEDELDDREIYYINLYHSFESDIGYNLTNGGGRNRVISESTRKKLSDNMLGEKHPNRREVICLDTMEIFVTIADAARSINVDYSAIERCCNGLTGTVKRLHWLFYNDYLNKSQIELDEVMKKENLRDHKVVCLNTGEIFHSIKDAHQQTGVNANTIGQCCLGNRKKAGFDKDGNPQVFMYYEDYLKKVSQQ